MTRLLFAAIPLSFLVVAAAPVHAQPPVHTGRVKTVSGAAQIVRSGQAMPARVGDLLFVSDTLRTGAGGRIGVTLEDDTRISLGPLTEVELRQFLYSPADGRLSFVMRILRGAAAYVSGRIAKLAPDAVRLETPTGIVGVRGTRLAIFVAPQ
jgi:hypothetical protein